MTRTWSGGIPPHAAGFSPWCVCGGRVPDRVAEPGAARGRRCPSVGLVGTVFRPARWAAQAFCNVGRHRPGPCHGFAKSRAGRCERRAGFRSTSVLPAMLDAVDSQRTPESSGPFSLDTFMPSIFTAAPEPDLPSKVGHRTLRDAIAAALYDVSARDLADECVRFGLAPQTPDEPDPMSGKLSYVKRRLRDRSIDDLLTLGGKVHEEYETPQLAHLLALSGAHGVAGDLKNLIFAAAGPKPKIVLRDAINNIIEITENAEHCLVYDRALPESGLTWRTLTAWHAGGRDLDEHSELVVARELYARLMASMDGNEAEQLLFAEYCRLYASHGFEMPALIPQVYLHYDPYAQHRGGTLIRQRMDFLLLLLGRRRVVLEIDGVQHYADKDRRASPRRYAEMVAEDRKLRLAGYEVYRFGGQELVDRDQARRMLADFFAELLRL